MWEWLAWAGVCLAEPPPQYSMLVTLRKRRLQCWRFGGSLVFCCLEGSWIGFYLTLSSESFCWLCSVCGLVALQYVILVKFYI